MTSLADEFLNDLDEDNQEGGDENSESDDVDDDDESIDSDDEDMFEQLNKETIDSINTTQLKVFEIAKLLKDEKLSKHIQKVEQFISSGRMPKAGVNLIHDEEFPYIVESNKICSEIDEEIMILHKFIRDRYSKKFPELENNVQNALDYARVVKRIGNETDLSKVDMTDILPSSIIMVVKVSSSTTTGKKLNEHDLMETITACDMILELDQKKNTILNYVSSRMTAVAPNLSVIVGTTIAAQLIGAAGGLNSLSKIPSDNIQLLGKQKKALAGFSSRTVIRHVGYIGNCELVNNTPPDLRKRVSRVVAGKSTLAARVDSFHSASDGSVGKKYREEILDVIKKWQQLPPAKQEKPLPIPNEKKKTRRGGKKARRAKEMSKMTAIRQKYNRIAFGQEEKEYGYTGKGLGMLGAESGMGSIRLAAETKIKAAKPRKQQNNSNSTSNPFYETSGVLTSAGTSTAIGNSTSGYATSLNFTPNQGIALENPENIKKRKLQLEGDAANGDKYFSNISFKKVKKE